MKSCIITILLISLCGCVTGGLQAVHKGVSIYQGQSTDSVERSLGSPDIVSGPYVFCRNMNSLPFGVSVGRNTLEWVYLDTYYSTVIYINSFSGRVEYVHQVPTSRIRR